MTTLMSTSLKVVSIAAVFCASLSRRAIVWRSRVIFTRSSRAASSAGGGGRTRHGAGGRGAGGGPTHLHGSGGLWDGRRLRGGALDCRHHVALGDAAILAAALDLGGIHAG